MKHCTSDLKFTLPLKSKVETKDKYDARHRQPIRYKSLTITNILERNWRKLHFTLQCKKTYKHELKFVI